MSPLSENPQVKVKSSQRTTEATPHQQDSKINRLSCPKNIQFIRLLAGDLRLTAIGHSYKRQLMKNYQDQLKKTLSFSWSWTQTSLSML
jgi:hypothetical protein